MDTLTPKQQTVAKAMCSGLTNKQIARIAHIEPCTVTFHIENLKQKFGAPNKCALAAILVARNFVKAADIKSISFVLCMAFTVIADSRSPDLSTLGQSKQEDLLQRTTRRQNRGRRELGVGHAV